MLGRIVLQAERDRGAPLVAPFPVRDGALEGRPFTVQGIFVGRTASSSVSAQGLLGFSPAPEQRGAHAP